MRIALAMSDSLAVSGLRVLARRKDSKLHEQESAPLEFYQKVRVISSDPKLAALRGKEGAILGRAQSADGQWYYAVHLYGVRDGWDFAHSDLEPTGEFDRRETFYEGSSLRVRVDAKGRGRIVQDE